MIGCPPFIPDAQTLLTVVATTELGIPAPNAACLAGACPKFALRTLPKITSCTSDGSIFALLRAATRNMKNSSRKGQKKPFQKQRLPIHEAEIKVLGSPSIAIDPSLVAGKDEREPRNPPIGVRATPTMQTSA